MLTIGPAYKVTTMKDIFHRAKGISLLLRTHWVYPWLMKKTTFIWPSYCKLSILIHHKITCDFTKFVLCHSHNNFFNLNRHRYLIQGSSLTVHLKARTHANYSKMDVKDILIIWGRNGYTKQEVIQIHSKKMMITRITSLKFCSFYFSNSHQ